MWYNTEYTTTSGTWAKTTLRSTKKITPLAIKPKACSLQTILVVTCRYLKLFFLLRSSL
jgi:hypothetical protein